MEDRKRQPEFARSVDILVCLGDYRRQSMGGGGGHGGRRSSLTPRLAAFAEAVYSTSVKRLEVLTGDGFRSRSVCTFLESHVLFAVLHSRFYSLAKFSEVGKDHLRSGWLDLSENHFS